MKPFRPLILGGALLLAGLFVFPTPAARAVYVLTVAQEGSDVVAAGSGTLDLADLTPNGTDYGGAVTTPHGAVFGVGPTTSGPLYAGIAGPSSFGLGDTRTANSDTGAFTVLNGSLFGGRAGVAVPTGYVSGDFLSGTATFDSTTFASLGITPGIYTYTWGSGADADSFILNAVPERST